MIRFWTATALLAGSWLFGLHYYQVLSWWAWAATILLATALLRGTAIRLPERRHATLALLLLSPVLLWMPWPYRVAPGLLATGLLLACLAPRRGSAAWASGCVTAGTMLLVQSLTMGLYARYTAASHDLPRPLPDLLGALASLLGANAAVDGPNLVLRSAREVHRLGATWDLLVDPASLGFLVGGLVGLGLLAASRPGGDWRRWLRASGTLALVVMAWLPLRASLLIALLLQRAARPDLLAPMDQMNQFLSPWLSVAMLAGAVLLAWRFVAWPAGDGGTSVEEPSSVSAGAAESWRRPAAAISMVLAGFALLTLAAIWDPLGSPKQGRVMVVEKHSTWEPTDRPYNTEQFGHDASYSYGAIYDYASRYFQMSRLSGSQSIDQQTLSQCDVLVVKVPTAPFGSGEIGAIRRFVEDGGGLLLVGDHTNVFLSTSYLNPIARPFGFLYRHDLLFCVGSPYRQPYAPPAVPHPAVQHLPPMEFAVSCSIDPGRSWGRAVVQNAGLWSLPPAYNASNFHPEAEYRPEMRYGSFVQVWAARHGAGRVMAFTDSTIFSNFCVFEPGKAELMLGMLDWLNRASLLDRGGPRIAVRLLLLLAAAALLAFGLRQARRLKIAWLVLLAAALLGAGGTAHALTWQQGRAMPPPAPERPMTRVALDRTVSEVALAHNGFTDRSGKGYGLLEQWVPRLGYFTARRSGADAFAQDALLVVCPTLSPSEDYQRRLVEYVHEGGRLIVIDSPDEPRSTANALLWPFGLSISRPASAKGRLTVAGAWPGIEVADALEVRGGESLVRVGTATVAARRRVGNGQVLAIGFGSAFQDESMGTHWMTQPDESLRTRFELLFRLLRSGVESQDLTAPRSEPAKPKSKPLPIPRRAPKPK